MAFEKILSHPNKSKIVSMLMRGEGVRKTSNFLKEMHPKDKKLWITPPTLQKFRKQYLDIEGESLALAKEMNKLRKNKKSLRKTNAFQTKMKESLEKHIDIRETLVGMKELLMSRVEDLFNKADNGEATTNQEKNLIDYFKTIFTMLDKQAKYVDKIADNTSETNINITVIEDQVAVLREAVRETMLEEMEPHIAVRFLDKLDKKMGELNYKYKRKPSVDEIHMDVKALNASFEDSANE